MKNKVRCNMYLDEESVRVVRAFLKGSGLTLSSYFDLLICSAAEKIKFHYSVLASQQSLEPLDDDDQIFYEKGGKQYFNILQAHKILGLTELTNINLKISENEGLPLSRFQIKRLAEGEWRFVKDESGYYVIELSSEKEKN